VIGIFEWSDCRADIAGILLCTSRLLFYCYDSLSQLLDLCDTDFDIHDVHNYCCCLLAALAVVGAPLQSLYRSLLRICHAVSYTMTALLAANCFRAWFLKGRQ